MLLNFSFQKLKLRYKNVFDNTNLTGKCKVQTNKTRSFFFIHSELCLHPKRLVKESSPSLPLFPALFVSLLLDGNPEQIRRRRKDKKDTESRGKEHLNQSNLNNMPNCLSCCYRRYGCLDKTVWILQRLDRREFIASSMADEFERIALAVCIRGEVGYSKVFEHLEDRFKRLMFSDLIIRFHSIAYLNIVFLINSR